MRNNTSLSLTIVLSLAFALILAGCDNGTIDGGGNGNSNPQAPAKKVEVRYQTVPYKGSAGPGDEPYALVYSSKDGTYKYYSYYAGYIDFVPLLYKQAVWYGGQTATTIGYEKNSQTENTVTHALETAVENSIEFSSSSEHSVLVTAGVEVGTDGAKASLETSYGFTKSVSETVGKSVSTTNTYETSTSHMEGETRSVSVTIGNNNEEPGMYRYALFATTDVFYNVTVNQATGKIDNVMVALCARPTTYWGIDYDPEPSGGANFGKTGAGDLIQIPDFSGVKFPEPMYVVTSPPAASPPEGTYASSQTITLSAAGGATIRYTTDGSSIPSRTNGTIYSTPFAITSYTVVNAVAYTDDQPESPVKTWRYDITEPGRIDTGWKTIRADGDNYTIKTKPGFLGNPSDTIRFDSFTANGSKIDISALKEKSSGFKTVNVYITMGVREYNDGYQYIALYSSETPADAYKLDEIKFEHGRGYCDKSWKDYDFHFQNIALTSFPGDVFVIRYAASGSGADDWEAGRLKVRLVFEK